MVDYYIPRKILEKIKEIIGNETFDDAKILIDTDSKFQDHIVLRIFLYQLHAV